MKRGGEERRAGRVRCCVVGVAADRRVLSGVAGGWTASCGKRDKPNPVFHNLPGGERNLSVSVGNRPAEFGPKRLRRVAVVTFRIGQSDFGRLRFRTGRAWSGGPGRLASVRGRAMRRSLEFRSWPVAGSVSAKRDRPHSRETGGADAIEARGPKPSGVAGGASESVTDAAVWNRVQSMRRRPA